MVGIGQQGKAEGAKSLDLPRGQLPLIAADGDDVGSQGAEALGVGIQFKQTVYAGGAVIAQVKHQHERMLRRVVS